MNSIVCRLAGIAAGLAAMALFVALTAAISFGMLWIAKNAVIFFWVICIAIIGTGLVLTFGYPVYRMIVEMCDEKL